MGVPPLGRTMSQRIETCGCWRRIRSVPCCHTHTRAHGQPNDPVDLYSTNMGRAMVNRCGGLQGPGQLQGISRCRPPSLTLTRGRTHQALAKAQRPEVSKAGKLLQVPLHSLGIAGLVASKPFRQPICGTGRQQKLQRQNALSPQQSA